MHIPHDKVSVESSEDKLQFRVDYLKTKDNNRQEEQVRRFTSYDVSYMEKYPQDVNGKLERIRKSKFRRVSVAVLLYGYEN